MKRTIFLSVALVAVLFSACGPKAKPKAPDLKPPSEELDAAVEAEAPKSLYQRLGAEEGTTALVKAAVARAKVNPKLKGSIGKFDAAKTAKVEAQLVAFVCQIAEGGCTFDGKEMKAANKGLKVTEAQWDAFVVEASGTMNDLKIGEDEQAELLQKIAPFKDEVVEKKK